MILQRRHCPTKRRHYPITWRDIFLQRRFFAKKTFLYKNNGAKIYNGGTFYNGKYHI